jgi:hypothetical protein
MGKREAAIKSLDRLYGRNSKIDKTALLAQIEETLEMERTTNSRSA